jgi:hypothetical protein
LLRKCDGVRWDDDPRAIVYIPTEALFPRHVEYEPVFSEEYSREDRIVVAGIPVSIEVACFSVEIVIEGPMEEARAFALVRDINESIEAETGLSCVLKSYP